MKSLIQLFPLFINPREMSTETHTYIESILLFGKTRFWQDYRRLSAYSTEGNYRAIESYDI
jgi:hypothetical protein